MDELITMIQSAVQANPSGIEWKTFVDTLTPRQTAMLHDTLRQLKRQKRFERYLRKNEDGTRTLIIRAFVAPPVGA